MIFFTEPWLKQHEAVVSAIEAKDPVNAEVAIRQHLRTILHDLDIHLSRTPEIFDRQDTDLQSLRRTPF